MGDEVQPAGLGGGDHGSDVQSFPDVFEEMKGNEDLGFLPMVLAPFPLRCP